MRKIFNISTKTILRSCFRCHAYLGSRSGRFSGGFQGVVAKYFNWWPAKPLAVELIALRLSFQTNLAYNFLEAHQQSSIKVPKGCGPASLFAEKVLPVSWDDYFLYSVDALDDDDDAAASTVAAALVFFSIVVIVMPVLVARLFDFVQGYLHVNLEVPGMLLRLFCLLTASPNPYQAAKIHRA